jgi:hypothetical protein
MVRAQQQGQGRPDRQRSDTPVPQTLKAHISQLNKGDIPHVLHPLQRQEATVAKQMPHFDADRGHQGWHTQLASRHSDNAVQSQDCRRDQDGQCVAGDQGDGPQERPEHGVIQPAGRPFRQQRR